MLIGSLIKKLQNIMRGDNGVDGDAQRLGQIVWILFLKVFDYKESDWEKESNWENDNDYVPVIPSPFRFKDWADPKNENGESDVKKQITGDELIDFVDNKLFPFLRGDVIEINGEKMVFSLDNPRALIVREFILGSTNYMKNGVYLRQVINEIASIDFDDTQERHMFNDIYETLLKGLQSAGKAGEFYTPRAITKFITDHVNPQIGEKIADFACGTGGFLVEALMHLQKQSKTILDNEIIEQSLYGIEWKPLPYMLAITNLLLHGINNPKIIHGDGLDKDVLDLSDDDLFDCILMNPPFGGNVDKSNLENFPTELSSSESADLFVARIIYCLKKGGRCGLILPDGLLFNGDNCKIALKKKLLNECNLHTIIRLPKTVFAPYTDINTNLLFFDKEGKTESIWFYRMDMPEGRKRFNKTKPITREDLNVVDDWLKNKKEIKDSKEDESMTETWKAKKYTYEEIEANEFNLDLCGFPHEEEEILEPNELISEYKKNKKDLDDKINNILQKITCMLGGN